MLCAFSFLCKLTWFPVTSRHFGFVVSLRSVSNCAKLKKKHEPLLAAFFLLLILGKQCALRLLVPVTFIWFVSFHSSGWSCWTIVRPSLWKNALQTSEQKKIKLMTATHKQINQGRFTLFFTKVVFFFTRAMKGFEHFFLRYFSSRAPKITSLPMLKKGGKKWKLISTINHN